MKENAKKALTSLIIYCDMKKILIRGRYFKKNGKLFFYNVGSGVSLKVKSRLISFDLSMPENSGYVYVIKDFDYEKKEKFYIENETLVKVEFEDDNIHYIDLVKANESENNPLLVNKIDVHGNILSNKESKGVQVKVYGDSSIAGFGILAHDGDATNDTNDGVLNFCFRALYSLKANFDIFAASGWGLTFSIYTNPKIVGIEKYTDKVCVKSNAKWKHRKPKLLLISLGTNDFSYIESNKDKKEVLRERFISSYQKLIEKERKNNKKLKILMIYGSLKEENVYNLIEKTYESLSKVFNNLYILKIPGDNSGISNHSYVSHHDEMANVLKTKIKEILN